MMDLLSESDETTLSQKQLQSTKCFGEKNKKKKKKNLSILAELWKQLQLCVQDK